MSTRNAMFYNSENSDRLYDADDFSDWLKKFFTTGVFYGDCAVLANGDMTVNAGTGYANVNGKVMIFDEESEITLDPANATYDRIDTIVVERNDTDREISIKYVKGDLALEPVPKAPVRVNDIYQLVLAEIYVEHGAVAITQADITDKRPDNDVCGYVVTPIDNFDFDEFSRQFEAYFNEFKTGNEADFLDWFDRMKGQLSEDAAGHLQNEIDDLSEDLDTLSAAVAGIPEDIGDMSELPDPTDTIVGNISGLNTNLVALENNISNKFAVLSGTTSSNINTYIDFSLPSGFTVSNTVIIGIQYLDGSIWRFCIYIPTEPTPITSAINTNTNHIQIYTRSENGKNKQVKVTIMRTDI